MISDKRWIQRYENYKNALNHLSDAINNVKNPSDLEKEGTIQRFEFTHELSWKVMKDFLEYEGITGIVGSRSATRHAFNKGLISDGQIWMDMIESRNRTVHTYQQDILEKEYILIKTSYYKLLVDFKNKMEEFL